MVSKGENVFVDLLFFLSTLVEEQRTSIVVLLLEEGRKRWTTATKLLFSLSLQSFVQVIESGWSSWFDLKGVRTSFCFSVCGNTINDGGTHLFPRFLSHPNSSFGFCISHSIAFAVECDPTTVPVISSITPSTVSYIPTGLHLTVQGNNQSLTQFQLNSISV